MKHPILNLSSILTYTVHFNKRGEIFPKTWFSDFEKKNNFKSLNLTIVLTDRDYSTHVKR